MNGATVTQLSSNSTWVAGEKTPTSIIDGYMSAGTDFTFIGHMIGAVKTGVTLDAIKFDSTNSLTLNLDFGAGTNNFSGNFAFQTVGNQAWSGNIASANGALSNSGFSATNAVTGTGAGNTITSSTINGSYYGATALKSVGGTFQFGTGTSTAFGSFKATKQ